MAAANQILNLIFDAISFLIGAIGVAYGGWTFFDGFTNDQPESKKKGIQTIVITAVSIIVLQTAKPIILAML